LKYQFYDGSKRFGRIEPPQSDGNVATSIVPMVMYWFDKVQKSQTHVKLHHRSGLLCCAMVQTGSEQLNHPELMRDYPMILVPIGSQWFIEVRYG